MQQVLVAAEQEQLLSVPKIASEYARGFPYTHCIERELQTDIIPRRVRRPSAKWSAHHHCILNVAIGYIAVCIFLLRRHQASVEEWMRVAVASIAGVGFFALMVTVRALLESMKDYHLLQHGTATTGRFDSGTVNDCEETTYRLAYTFYVLGELYSNEVSVSKSDYIRYTTQNPYFTVLYHPRKLPDSTPYFQITRAHL
ncbi:MAG: hypothetical protein H7145_08800 [Akkermansiaceae bacterium]|nr:hypothetical protein [Armatimonadota bacterium]